MRGDKSSTHFDYVQEVRGYKSPKVDPPVTRANKHQSPRQVWALAGGKPTLYLSTATMLCHAEKRRQRSQRHRRAFQGEAGAEATAPLTPPARTAN